jgi:hypothetical protein
VDAEHGNRALAFDHQKLAEAFSKAAGQEFNADRLPFAEIEFTDDGKSVRFEAAGKKWTCNLTTYECGPVTGGTSTLTPSALTVDSRLATASPTDEPGSIEESSEHASPAVEDGVLAPRQAETSQGHTNGQQRARGVGRAFGGRRGGAEREASSPDGKWTAFIKEHNLYARSRDDAKELQLSQDGSETNSCGRLG